jgi:5-methylcytosine-specific restriction endonuclease McrA
MKHFIIPELPDLRFPWFSRPPIDLWIRLKQFVYERDGGLCQYCKQQVEYRSTHCHHTLELSEGGTNHPSNLKTLCIPCHKKRHPFMKNAKERLEEMT